jgi:hypothetical protein
MGYTIGRRHTEESLKEIALLYKTRAEFQKNDSSAYSCSRKRGKQFLDSICGHMFKGSYSMPQLICKVIMEGLLKKSCLYNTRKIIKPYELDLYFEEYKLAIEYNGKGWHEKEEAKKRDFIKSRKCDDLNITLITLIENSRKYEQDIKSQLINFLPIINMATNNFFVESEILSIDCSEALKINEKFSDLETIKKEINSCSNIADFQKKYISSYNFLRKINRMDMLDDIREIKPHSNEEIISMCKKILYYSDFVKNNIQLYRKCHKRKILKDASSHMIKGSRPKY